jgi:hypothetical protein
MLSPLANGSYVSGGSVVLIWFVPALLALSGMVMALYQQDYDLARRSAGVLIVSFGMVYGFMRLAQQQSRE